MTGAELVVAAMAAGAATGLSETVSGAVQDAYGALRGAVRRRLATRGEGRASVLDTYEAAPDVWQGALTDELRAAGADRDHELIAFAERLLAQLEPQPAAGKYHVDASQAKGVQTGDHNTQTNTFN